MSAVYALEWATIVQVTVFTTAGLVMIAIAGRHAAWRNAIGVWGLSLVLASPLLAAVLPRPFWLPAGEPRSEFPSAARDGASRWETLDGPSAGNVSDAAATAPAATDLVVLSHDSPPGQVPQVGRADLDATRAQARAGNWPLSTAAWAGNLLWACGAVWLFWRRWNARASINELRRSLPPWAASPAVGDESDICRELGLKKLPPIMLSDLAPMPLVLGGWNAVLVLPRALAESASAATVRSVVMHEAAHIARRDHWILGAQQAAQILFWWHPGVRWLNRQISRSREEICDNYVLRRSHAAAYAETLLDLAERRAAPLFLGLFSARWSLEERIAGLVSPQRITATHARPGGMAGLVLLLLAISVLVGGAGTFDVRSVAAPPPAVPKSSQPAAGVQITPQPERRAAEVPAQAAGKPAPAVLKKITIRGVCVDKAQAPIADARVRVFRCPRPLGIPLLVADLRPDEEGKFVANGVETAIGSRGFRGSDLCIAATADGRVSALEWITKEALRQATSDDVEEVEVSLVLPDNPGTLSGTVTDESGRPVPGVAVFLPSSGSQPFPGIYSAVTDAAGHYAISDLKRWTREGTRKFDPQTGHGTMVAFCNMLLDHPEYGRSTAHYSGVPQTVDVTLHPPAIVEGSVIDTVTNRPAANVAVSAQGVARGGWYQTLTNPQGRFRLLMTKDHYNIWADAEDRIAVAAKAVEVVPGKTVSLAEIRLVRGGFVTGRFIDPATNEPPPPVNGRPWMVGHYGPARPRTGAAVTSTEVEADGSYRLRVAPGTNFVYLMSVGTASRVVTVEDGQEVKADLLLNESAPDYPAAFAADLLLQENLRRQAQDEDAPRPPLPRAKAAKPTAKTAAPKRRDTPTGRLLDKLEAQNAGDELFKDSWCRTLKEIVDLGPAAVPELIQALDATDSDVMLRCLGFTLRAIGDPRAVPALIRAVPKTLRPPGSDMGLRADKDELVKFAQKYDLDPTDRDNHYGFGRPVREISGALEKLTGQDFGEEQLYHVFLDGLPFQRRMKRALYQQTARAWADWWEKEGSKLVPDAAYARVDLAPLVAQEAAAPPPPGMHFKVDHGNSGWVLESVLNPQAKSPFYDLDTGRVAGLPERFRAERNVEERIDEIVAWARGEGFDLMGTEYASPNDSKRVFAIRSLGLAAWELGSNRWKMQSDDILLETLKEEGTPADELLLHRDKESQTLDPKAIATFVYVTPEGTPGLLFVGVEVQDDSQKPGGRSEGDLELQAIGFRKGRRFGYKNFQE